MEVLNITQHYHLFLFNQFMLFNVAFYVLNSYILFIVLQFINFLSSYLNFSSVVNQHKMVKKMFNIKNKYNIIKNKLIKLSSFLLKVIISQEKMADLWITLR